MGRARKGVDNIDWLVYPTSTLAEKKYHHKNSHLPAKHGKAVPFKWGGGGGKERKLNKNTTSPLLQL